MHTTELSGALGVQVEDLPPVADLTARDIAELRALMAAHHLLCFRSGAVSGDDQLALCANFGHFRRISFADPAVAGAITAWEDEQGRSFDQQAIE